MVRRVAFRVIQWVPAESITVCAPPRVRSGKGRSMKHASGIGRLAGLAVGLGIGAALAATPGVASADDLDFQISIDGYDLLPTAGNEASATTTAGDLGIAIAIGDGASATATDGNGDYAVATVPAASTPR